MWFKMGMDIFNGVVVRNIRISQYNGDRSQDCRVMAFIQLLSMTAEDYANDLQDADDLARLVDTTPKQAKIVWDVCIKHGVLRKGPQGYSAKPWMVERGILGDVDKYKKETQKTQKTHETPPPGLSFYKTDGAKTSW